MSLRMQQILLRLHQIFDVEIGVGGVAGGRKAVVELDINIKIKLAEVRLCKIANVPFLHS